MSFHPRRSGHTLSRGREDRLALASIRDPHPNEERFDPDFRGAMRCNRCGKLCYGPKRFLREAMQEHWAHDCSARHNRNSEPMEALILYPKQ